MTATEVRQFRSTCKKLVEAEERGKLLKKLLKNGLSLKEDEEFIHNSDQKMKFLGNKNSVMIKKHEEFSKLFMKYKIKDNLLYSVKLRKKKIWLRGRAEASLGSRSRECRILMRDVKE